jgi:hypothetical protein
MRIIGLLGGATVYELGTINDVQTFFDCVDKYVMRQTDDVRWNLITDKLYQRYLMLEDLPRSSDLMAEIKRQFEQISTIDAGLKNQLDGKSRLDLSRETLAEVFGKFFEVFLCCKEEVEVFSKRFGTYQPLRIVIGDMPQLVNEKVRKLDQYDNLTGEPFWKR